MTFRQIDAIAPKLRLAVAKDAKRLKRAELLMEHTTRRLSDMLHITAGDQRVALQSTLSRVNALQNLLLAQVFSR